MKLKEGIKKEIKTRGEIMTENKYTMLVIFY